MSKYPVFSYSNREVRRAGETIASDMVWTEETDLIVRQAFEIANNWRDSHAYPLRSVRYSVIHHMRHTGLTGLTAARLKRMPAIRRKLRRQNSNFKLNQLQDLGGCRVIMDDITGVTALVDLLRRNARHDIRGEDNYTFDPKDDGYRSHHLKLAFKGRTPETSVFDGRRIELQVRTRLQHAWATAVEAVGLFRGEDLKGHQGNADWLRLFALISAEFAEAEKCPLPPGCLGKEERIAEIRRLERSVGALASLDSIRLGVRGTDFPLMPGYRPSHYLIRYVHATKTVFVSPFNAPKDAARSYDNAEAFDNRADSDTETVVLVEVDKIENLKAAYPNYFGDVDYFKEQFRRIVRGNSVVEYADMPQELLRRSSEKWGDLGWLRRSRFPAPSSGGSGKRPPPKKS